MRRYVATPAVAVAAVIAASSLAKAQDSLPPKAKTFRGPSQKELLFGSTASGVLFAANGVIVTTIVHGIACDGDGPSKRVGFFGPCWPSDESIAIGWYGGSFVGAAGVAAAVAMQRGCPPAHAVWRATLGASLGVLPGLVARNTRLSRVPLGRHDLAITTPLVAGLGAFIATVGCQD